MSKNKMTIIMMTLLTISVLGGVMFAHAQDVDLDPAETMLSLLLDSESEVTILFETIVNDKPIIWECLSDYWELVDTDLRKVSEVLSVEESSEVGIFEKLKHILKWGCCK